jgi:magnesium transporter
MIPFYKNDSLTTLEKVKKTILLSNKELKHSFIQMEDDVLLELFSFYDVQTKWRMFHLLDMAKQKSVITHMRTDELVDFIHAFNEDKTHILSLVDNHVKQRIERLLNYHETLAGSLMSDHYLIFNSEKTAGEALKSVIHETSDNTYIDDIFVEEDGKLIGRISLAQLVVARKGSLLKFHIQPILMKIYPESDLLKTIEFMMDYDKESVPVIDNQGAMIGLITAESVLEEVVESYDDDFKSLTMIQNIETFDNGIKRYLKRMPWLLIALIFNVIIALTLQVFEETLASITAIILFQPLISGMSGNIATQALAVTLLKDENIRFKSQFFKEITIGFMNGFFIGVISFLVTTGFLITLGNPISMSIELGLLVSISLWISMIFASLIGVSIPYLLKYFKKNEALASGPLITTLNDFIALTIYFTIMTLWI